MLYILKELSLWPAGLGLCIRTLEDTMSSMAKSEGPRLSDIRAGTEKYMPNGLTRV